MVIDKVRDVCIINISAGESHVLALEQSNLVWAWGSNKYGQLGMGQEHTMDLAIPERIPRFGEVHRIYTGINCSFAINMDGEMYSWGENKNDQLGHPDKKVMAIYYPTVIRDARWNKSVQLSVIPDNRGKHVVYENKRIASSAEPMKVSGPSEGNTHLRQL
jgi:alpha-tubulin suppressor-like RCC1 family protein